MAANTSDPTFRSYTSQQAKSYASNRPSYSSAIYNVVFEHHANTGGQFGLLVDCGCGPGNATRDMAASFDHAIGVDAGPAMIEAARSVGGTTKIGEAIKFEVAPAETFSELESLKPESVDLLTVATAVHWFNMNKFYAEAAKVVKPGGTVAFWTRASGFPHPDTANAQKLKEIMLHFERDILGPYGVAGNQHSAEMYDNLPLPWDVSPPVKEFTKSDYIKHDYDRDGILSDGKNFFAGAHNYSYEQAEKILGTASMVTRWREAHPDLANTDKDCVKIFLNELREASGNNDDWLAGSATTILLFKKST
ncbi:S-adenosyl-L-methionine-dependent methyltransferase [Tricladium varicosporioides]|nr:S-adenosyl-L-methionine-dependent methyltransferase [Hymenoscyphus varicosporioides]